MFYKDIYSTNPREQTRALRQLFVVKCYDGDPDDPDVEISEEKVIAWNACDAIRRVNRPVVEQPVRECFVTWHDVPMKIYSALDGPTDEKADPTVGAITEEDFTK